MTFNADMPRAIILLYKDGTVHLCCDNYTSYHLTAEMLISFLTSPSVFLDRPIDMSYDSSERINPTGMALDKLPGVTMATFSYSRKLTVIFPELLKHVFSLSSGPQKANKLNMRNFITRLDHSDAKAFLLRYFLDFSRDVEKGVIVQNVFNIDEDSFCAIMREIFNATISFIPPKPTVKTVEQCLNEAMQESIIKKNTDSFLIPLPEYVRRNGLIYQQVSSAVKRDEFKTVVKDKGRYYIDYREKPPKSLFRVKADRKSQVNTKKEAPTSSPFGEDYMSPEQIQQYISDNKLFSNLVARYIYSKQELDFYIANNYHEVEWDGFHYLICDIDMSLQDEKGLTNEQRILENDESPVSINPETQKPEPVHLHHLGQREAVLVPIAHHMHSKYHAVFHAAIPTVDLHTKAFEATKKTFWKRFLSEYKKAGSFEKIYYIYPYKTKI